MKGNERKLRVAVYAAFSPEEAPESETFSIFFREYLRQKGNYALVGIYMDRSPTATLETRPEWQRLVADKMEDVFDVVMIPSLNQLSASNTDAVWGVRRLTAEPHPVMVEFMYERIHVPDVANDMQLSFYLMIAEEIQQLQSNAKELRDIFERAVEEKQQGARMLLNNG